MTTQSSVWSDRTLVALANLPAGSDLSVPDVLEEVAIQFADRFAPADRDYGGSDKPRWHHRVTDALTALQADGLVAKEDGLKLTPDGQRSANAARTRLDSETLPDSAPTGETHPAAARQFIVAGVIAPPLRDPDSR